MKHNILLWGTGDRAKRFIDNKYFDYCNILGFVDTYKKDFSFSNYPVYSPMEMKELIDKVEYIVIVNYYFLENIELCKELGIDCNKIVITYNVQEPEIEKKFEKLKEISADLYEYMKNFPMRLVKINESDYKDKDKILGNDRYKSPLYMQDYFRYRTFEFAEREIIKNGVMGAVAELGVFRGSFSAMINEIFKDRKLYLFDTFEGFSEDEAENEILMGRCDQTFVLSHKCTSLKRMLANIPYPEKCIVCMGFFPDSIKKEAFNESYAFVSIDVDFEESTYQGLKFFYPRLSDGGMIFIHDYNTFYLEGVKQAINRFEKDFKMRLKKIPLADRAGTLVIVR